MLFCCKKLLSNFYKYKRKFHNNYHHKFYTKNYSTCQENFKHLKVVFFGTDNFSLPSLKALYNESKLENSKISSIGVVTSFKLPSNPVRNFAKENNLNLYKWPMQLTEQLDGYDLGIVVSFGHLISNEIISKFSLGMINVHASLLPRWRGAAPIIYAIMNDDKITGVTIMRIKPYHFDIGEILAQKEIKIKSDILLPELHDQLSDEGSKLLLDVLRKTPESLKNGKQQDENLVTYAPKVTQKLTKIDWNQMAAYEVYNRYRALYSFEQLTTSWENHTIKIVELKYNKINSNNDDNSNNPNTVIKPNPGFIEYSKIDKSLKVYCNDRHYVNLLKIKIEGKKIISAIDFNNGYLKKCKENQRYFQ